MYIYDRLKGSFSYYDFSKHNNAYPVCIGWDNSDDRVLCCEALQNKTSIDKNMKNAADGNLDMSLSKNNNNTTANTTDDKESCSEVFIFFATTEQGILLQDTFIKSSAFGPLIGTYILRLGYLIIIVIIIIIIFIIIIIIIIYYYYYCYLLLLLFPLKYICIYIVLSVLHNLKITHIKPPSPLSIYT
jgi:hypothetical protein